MAHTLKSITLSMMFLLGDAMAVDLQHDDVFSNDDWLYNAASLADGSGAPWPDVADLLTAAPMDDVLPLPGRIARLPSGNVVRWSADGKSFEMRFHEMDAAHVPEPSSLWLLGLAGAVLIIGVPLYRRARKQRKMDGIIGRETT